VGVDYVVDLSCAVKSDIRTDRLVGLIKGRSQANTVLELARRDGVQSSPAEIVFGRVRQLPGGTTYEDVSVQALLDEAAPPRDYEHYCAGCPANSRGEPFGCYGYLSYPISPAIEAWLLARLPESLNGVAGQLLRVAVRDFGYDGGRIRDMRRRGDTFFERNKPAQRTWRRGLTRWTLTSDQLLQMLIGRGNLNPEHCALLALYLGVIPHDSPPEIVRDPIALRRAVADAHVDAGTEAPEQWRSFLKALALAVALNVHLLIDS